MASMVHILSLGQAELQDHPSSLDIQKVLERMKRRDYLTSLIDKLLTNLKYEEYML
jgi:hypothetical protein